MAWSFKILATAIAVLFPLTSCSDSAAEPVPTVTLQSVWLDESFPDEKGCWTDNQNTLCPVIVSQEGVLTHQGVEIAPSDALGISEEWQAFGHDVLEVAVHPFARYAAVVERLADLNKAMPSNEPRDREIYAPPHFGIPDLERRYRNVLPERNFEAVTELQEDRFVGEPDERDLPVLVGYSEEYRACVFQIDGISLSSIELNDQSFTWLDRLVQSNIRTGGSISDNVNSNIPVAIIQAKAQTPWQCVGGALHAVQAAGWPFFKLEVVGD